MNRRSKLSLLIFSFVLFSADLISQDSVKYLLAGQVLDVKTGQLDKNVLFTIENNIITEIDKSPDLTGIADDMDLSEYTVLPGLMDCHTHLADPHGPSCGLCCPG